MNKEKIISTVSIDFGFSKEKAGKIVNAVFETVMKALNNNGELSIQKFGRFKLYTEKETGRNIRIKFTPAKKLALRVNSDFRNLKKVKIKKDLKTAEEKFRKYDLSKSGTEFQNGDIPETSGWINNRSGSRKTLISEDLINLHKEITKEVKKNS